VKVEIVMDCVCVCGVLGSIREDDYICSRTHLFSILSDSLLIYWHMRITIQGYYKVSR